MDLLKIMGIAAVTTVTSVIGAAVAVYLLMEKPRLQVEEFENVYKPALVRYADPNHNGVTSREEEKEFNRKLYSNCGFVSIEGSLPRHSDGSRVSVDDLINCVRDYKPSE
jgi:hypothetical protein